MHCCWFQGPVPHVSAGVSATTQPRMSGPWTTSTLASSVPTCAAGMAGVTTVSAGMKHLSDPLNNALLILQAPYYFPYFPFLGCCSYFCIKKFKKTKALHGAGHSSSISSQLLHTSLSKNPCPWQIQALEELSVAQGCPAAGPGGHSSPLHKSPGSGPELLRWVRRMPGTNSALLGSHCQNGCSTKDTDCYSLPASNFLDTTGGFGIFFRKKDAGFFHFPVILVCFHDTKPQIQNDFFFSNYGCPHWIL